MRTDMHLGDLINGIYESFLTVYGDPELALIATEVTLTEMIDAADRREELLAA
jgi:hypothetical protein